jgi:hypothetical protein
LSHGVCTQKNTEGSYRFGGWSGEHAYYTHVPTGSTILSVFWKIPPHVSALLVSEGYRSKRIDDSLRRTISLGQPAPGSKSFAANAAVRPQRAPNTVPIQYLPSTGAK